MSDAAGPRPVRDRVDAVVVTHGPDPDLPSCLAALQPQVRRIVVVANLPGSPEVAPTGGLLLVNDRPAGFAANVNRGVARTDAEYVVVANPDAVAAPDAVERLVRFADSRPAGGVFGPELRYPDGTWQPSRRAFPTVLGTAVRRTPLRLLVDPVTHQRGHYLLDEQPTDPTPADWLLGGFLLLRRRAFDELGGLDEAYRLYGEDIDLGYRAAKAGWERWLVPRATVVHRYHAVIDQRFLTRRTWWHLRGMAHFVRRHPERLRALR
ncbi:MAG TPA: glycosyltransferase family 2 protein [Acidimicrobiales bacterium]|nr:glycosyltransferase family 2 protein [Acidimicrobiales bacterium]